MLLQVAILFSNDVLASLFELGRPRVKVEIKDRGPEVAAAK